MADLTFDAGSVGLIGATNDRRYGGAFYLSGTTKVKGAPNTPRLAQLCVFRQDNRLLIRVAYSDPLTGNWRTDDLSGSTDYLVVALDVAKNYRAIAADRVSPKPA